MRARQRHGCGSGDPQGKARIGVRVSAAHRREDLTFAIEAFAAVKEELGV